MHPRTLRPWLYSFLAWTLIGLVYFAQSVTRRFYWEDPEPWQDLRYWLASIYTAALLTPLILAAGKRWPLERQHLVRLVALHFALSIAWTLLKLALEAAFHLGWNEIWPITPPITLRSEFTLLLLFGFHTSVIAYWTVLAILTAWRNYGRFQETSQAALRSELRASQLETQVAQARLGALKAQLQPHFLFNTLNAIVVLVRQQKGQEAEQTLARFSDLLRAVLADMDAQEVPLSREMHYLELYLGLEELRFSDRLRVNIDIDAELLDAAVPHMALQPIVENAIRHGVGSRASFGIINISAARRGDTLELKVCDNGPGFGTACRTGGMGLGLANTRARLRQLYGGAAELLTGNAPDGGALVTMRLPFRVVESA